MLYILMNDGSELSVNPNQTHHQFAVAGITNMSERSIALKDVVRIELSGITYKRVLDMCPNLLRLNQGSAVYRGEAASFVLDNWNRIMNWTEWNGEYEVFE